MSKDDIEKIISESLVPGSSQSEIVSFFESQGWDYGFNRHFNRYLASNPKENELPDIYGRNQIYIYVNDEKQFVKAEVEKVFNGL